MAWQWLLGSWISSAFGYCLYPCSVVSTKLLLPTASTIFVSWPKHVYYHCRLALLYIMRRWNSQRPPRYEAPACINRLPNELFDIIIREYSTVSIDLSPKSPINFLLVCPKWTAIGQTRQHLFRSNHLVISGHGEIQQLLFLIRHGRIPLRITSLAVNLALTYPLSGLWQSNELLMAIYEQIYDDLSELRIAFFTDWNTAYDGEKDWDTLNLHHFSLHVNFSGVSAGKEMLKEWVWRYVSRIGIQWRERGWRGSDGFYGEDCYSYWDR